MDTAARTQRSATALLRRVFLVLLAVEALAGSAALGLASPDSRTAVALALIGGLATLGGAFLVVDRGLAAPLDRLARDLTIVARDHPALELATPRWPWLRRLTAASRAVQARLRMAEGSIAEQLATATARVEDQKRRLETLLLDLSEGVVVCGLDHQVLLFNQAAADLLDEPHAIGLGRSLLAALSREAILHHLDRLLHHERGDPPATERFVCATAVAGRLRRARMALLTDHAGAPTGYVLSLADAGAEFDEGARGDRMLRTAVERQRGMLGSLRAAAETLAGGHDLSAEERERFETVVLDETLGLAEQNAVMARALDESGRLRWVMSEVHTGDLIASLQRRLGATLPMEIVQAGLPDWLLVDSLSLIELLEHLIAMLAREQTVRTLTVAVARHGRLVDLDLIWQGQAIRAADLDGWLEVPFVGGKGVADGRGVLQRHGTDCWSRSERAGEALIRIPLPAAEPPEAIVTPRSRPPRPEFYDFDLAATSPSEALKERPLRSLAYVVFDVETTGLDLSGGDVPVAIGAVRVVNGRVLPLESFERVINPGRPIPPSSTGFHGITDAMVAGRPPLSLVLSQFSRFVGEGAVLVAHNAAFDMTALHRGAAASGLSFDHPVVDTLLISASLDPEETNHSLDAIAARLGLAVAGRHDALGDALLTAAVLVRQIETLEERGIERLGQLLAATDMRGRLRANQMQF
jgi:DNA polymerase III subunit epsilon